MLAQAEKLLIVGHGTVDLKTEKLDIEFNTKPRTGVGVTADMFVTPFVKLSGTLGETRRRHECERNPVGRRSRCAHGWNVVGRQGAGRPRNRRGGSMREGASRSSQAP